MENKTYLAKLNGIIEAHQKNAASIEASREKAEEDIRFADLDMDAAVIANNQKAYNEALARKNFSQEVIKRAEAVKGYTPGQVDAAEGVMQDAEREYRQEAAPIWAELKEAVEMGIAARDKLVTLNDEFNELADLMESIKERSRAAAHHFCEEPVYSAFSENGILHKYVSGQAEK